MMNASASSHIKLGSTKLVAPGADANGWMGRTGLESSSGHPIVLACDEAYAMPLSTTLRSLVEANRNNAPLDVFILTPKKFSSCVKEKVLRSLPQGSSVTIMWVPVDLASFKDFSIQSYASTMAYARLLIPYIFSEAVTKVLYLDVDILVLGELDPLWETDLEGVAIGAVVDTFSKDNAKRLQLSAQVTVSMSDANSAPPECDYFNSGVLLINLPRWRQEQISERALQYLVQNPQNLLMDQDALNVVYAGRWKQLDVRWNLQTHDPRGYSQIPVEEWPSIVHFAGKYTKPWLASNLNVNAGFFDAYRRRTQFARKPHEKVCDAVLHCWAWSRSFLKRYKLISFVYNFLTRPRNANGVSL